MWVDNFKIGQYDTLLYIVLSHALLVFTELIIFYLGKFSQMKPKRTNFVWVTDIIYINTLRSGDI